MMIFAGLGNPGPKYAGNRHNIGFMAVDRIAADHGFGPWKSRFQAQVSEGRLAGEKLLLIKPMTFMNRSGQALAEALRFYKLDADCVTVFHDELDLAPGRIKTKQGGGHAGHNGLRSLHAHIGDGYARVRLGIGHPGRKELVANYVLHDFHKSDRDWLDPLLTGIGEAAPHLAAGDSGRFMNAVALHTAPPRSSASAPKTGRKPAASDKPKPKPAAEPEADTRNPLQRLMERFR